MNLLEHYALMAGTDKYEHGYCPFYSHHLEQIRHRELSLLEIGVQGEHSMHMWNAYFPKVDAHGIDIKFSRRAARATYHLLDVESMAFEDWCKTCKEWDIVVDDGGHTMKQQQLAFKLLWPKLKDGGIFLMEDLHTSSEYFSKTHNPYNNVTTLELIQSIVDKRDDFSSAYFSNEEYRRLLSEVSYAEVWSKVPGVFADSTTCIIVKRENGTIVA